MSGEVDRPLCYPSLLPCFERTSGHSVWCFFFSDDCLEIVHGKLKYNVWVNLEQNRFNSEKLGI